MEPLGRQHNWAACATLVTNATLTEAGEVKKEEGTKWKEDGAPKMGSELEGSGWRIEQRTMKRSQNTYCKSSFYSDDLSDSIMHCTGLGYADFAPRYAGKFAAARTMDNGHSLGALNESRRHSLSQRLHRTVLTKKRKRNSASLGRITHVNRPSPILPMLKAVDPEDEKSMKWDDLARFLTPHLILLLLSSQLSLTEKLQIAGIMAGYQKPRLHGYSTLRLIIGTLLGLSLNLVPGVKSLETFYLSVYMAGYLTIWTVVLGQFFFPAPGIKPSQLFDVSPRHFRRSHVSHMRIYRLRRCPGYQDPRLSCYSFSDFLTVPRWFLSTIMAIPRNLHSFWASKSLFETRRYSADQGPVSHDSDSDDSEYNGNLSRSRLNEYGFRSRSTSQSYPRNVDILPSSGEVFFKIQTRMSWIQTVLVHLGGVSVKPSPQSCGNHRIKGRSDHRVAFILDVTNSPECLAFVCQDSITGPTGSRDVNKLAEVLILDDGVVIDCRRSNLTCGGFWTCPFAASDFLKGFERVEGDSEDLISAPIHAAKSAEAGSLIAIASEFYQSVISKYCKGKVEDENFSCGGHAIMRKYTKGASTANHALSDAPIARTHFRDGKHVRGTLVKRTCPAKILILIPVDENDLRAVVIPAAGMRHNHPLFPRTKVPFVAASQYIQCVESNGPIGATTLRVDKSSSTHTLLNGKLPQELHPSLINNRKWREYVYDSKTTRFPPGTGMEGRVIVSVHVNSCPESVLHSAVWHEFEQDRTRALEDRYIHAVNTLADDIHVIITVNPELAELTLEASWIMVDTTVVVVHGKTNEWKLLIWLNGLDKRRVIGRVWSNRATREAFVLVWNGIFEAIEALTGKALNFKVFSKTSCLLDALGDSEGAQAQALGDVIILRRLNLKEVDGTETVDVDTILMFIWKTCIVHFNRGVFALEAYVEDRIFQYLLSFPYLETDAEIQEYYSFCKASTIPKLKAWWRHKLSYPWLLHSLNPQLSKMSNKFWDLTPRDTNPIEGSHAQDNQVNKTNSTLIEAILLARQLDSENARIIKASIEFGIWENGNNSMRARFSSQAAWQSRARVKKAETAKSESGTKNLRAQLQAPELHEKDKDAEMQCLHARLNLGPFTTTSVANAMAGQSNLNRYISPSPKEYIDVDQYSPPPMKALNLFSGLRTMTPIAEPRSDFDYPGALDSDIMDRALKGMEGDHPMYAVNSDDEVLASDPYPVI
ncbi:hypothetical protein B0H13DRAFT_1879033 [Mycena leptocephala]|nr:hypothetical protein B0H13DRAFT_1879033 [Mycena leptocephala]